jgi:hypothetical protein
MLLTTAWPAILVVLKSLHFAEVQVAWNESSRGQRKGEKVMAKKKAAKKTAKKTTKKKVVVKKTAKKKTAKKAKKK